MSSLVSINNSTRYCPLPLRKPVIKYLFRELSFNTVGIVTSVPHFEQEPARTLACFRYCYKRRAFILSSAPHPSQHYQIVLPPSPFFGIYHPGSLLVRFPKWLLSLHPILRLSSLSLLSELLPPLHSFHRNAHSQNQNAIAATANPK